MTLKANIPLRGWRFYQTNLTDSNNPFSVCTVSGSRSNPGYLMSSTGATQRLNSHQLRLNDVCINTYRTSRVKFYLKLNRIMKSRYVSAFKTKLVLIIDNLSQLH